jgi:hypothetical protein
VSAASLTVRSRSATGRGGGAEVKEEGDDIGEQCSSLVRRQQRHPGRVTGKLIQARPGVVVSLHA